MLVISAVQCEARPDRLSTAVVGRDWNSSKRATASLDVKLDSDLSGELRNAFSSAAYRYSHWCGLLISGAKRDSR